ncbi:MAG: TspO/MBR family protein [Candidatus Krumholzibacteria bacterium]|jgi:tryptophan-rich sensory protein|nr:TspO/MBR family protein [Candidatus Krumholzibacteria bacterium]
MPNASCRRPTLALVACLGATFAAAAIGGLASVRSTSFYSDLARPAWAPPAGVFGPVWTVLYVMMALAAWLAWLARHRRSLGDVRLAAVLFGAQLGANALWTWLFFAWRLGLWAFVEILVLWGLIAATAFVFWRLRHLAGLLLLPYLAWVSFAAALTFAIWRLNPHLLQ